MTSTVIITNKTFDDFCTLANSVLSHMSKWFTANKPDMSLYKRKIIQLVINNSLQHALHIGYNGIYVDESANKHSSVDKLVTTKTGRIMVINDSKGKWGMLMQIF
jgi:hypothetical protein